MCLAWLPKLLEVGSEVGTCDEFIFLEVGRCLSSIKAEAPALPQKHHTMTARASETFLIRMPRPMIV
jgi:hypothetical protein